MPLAQSKLTAQGQISIPAVIRRKLGVGPGSTVEWEEKGEEIVLRRAGRYTFEDIHKRLFPDGPPRRRSLKELKEGIRQYIRAGHARGRY
jgi:antitoxin PrlF